MPRMNSIFADDFIKTLEDRGLLKQAYNSIQEYKDDPNARASSQDLKAIEMLYDTKPESIYDYEDCITESAHPDSLVIAPSYDKLHGLVENDIERANIMHNIVMQMPTGNYGKKYAHQELALELVRIANEMDTKDREELYALADTCLAKLTECQRQPQIKQALAPLAIVGIAAACLAAVWLLSHTTNKDSGPLANIDRAISALNDLKTNSWYESDVDETVQKDAGDLKNEIVKLKKIVLKFNKAGDFVYKPRTLNDAQELVKLKETAKTNGDFVAQAVQECKSELANLEPMLSQAMDNFKDEYYQNSHTKPSAVSEMTGWLGEAIKGRWGLLGNEFITVVNTLEPLQASLEQMIGRFENFDKVADKFEAKIQAAQVKYNPSAQPTTVEQDETGSMQAEYSKTTNAPKTPEQTKYQEMVAQVRGDGESKEFLNHVMNGTGKVNK